MKQRGLVIAEWRPHVAAHSDTQHMSVSQLCSTADMADISTPACVKLMSECSYCSQMQHDAAAHLSTLMHVSKAHPQWGSSFC